MDSDELSQSDSDEECSQLRHFHILDKENYVFVLFFFLKIALSPWLVVPTARPALEETTSGADNYKRDEQLRLLPKHIRQSEDQASIRWAATAVEFCFFYLRTQF